MFSLYFVGTLPGGKNSLESDEIASRETEDSINLKSMMLTIPVNVFVLSQCCELGFPGSLALRFCPTIHLHRLDACDKMKEKRFCSSLPKYLPDKIRFVEPFDFPIIHLVRLSVITRLFLHPLFVDPDPEFTILLWYISLKEHVCETTVIIRYKVHTIRYYLPFP